MHLRTLDLEGWPEFGEHEDDSLHFAHNLASPSMQGELQRQLRGKQMAWCVCTAAVHRVCMQAIGADFCKQQVLSAGGFHIVLKFCRSAIILTSPLQDVLLTLLVLAAVQARSQEFLDWLHGRQLTHLQLSVDGKLLPRNGR